MVSIKKSSEPLNYLVLHTMISLESWASEYMGTWGTGIFSNDTACEVRNMYRDYLACGHKDDMAEEKVTKNALTEEMAQIRQDRDDFLRALRGTYSMLAYCKKTEDTALFLKYANMYIDLYHEACNQSHLFDQNGKTRLIDVEFLYAKQVESDMQNKQE